MWSLIIPKPCNTLSLYLILLWKIQPIFEVSWPELEEHTVHTKEPYSKQNEKESKGRTDWRMSCKDAVVKADCSCAQLPLRRSLFQPWGRNTEGCGISDIHIGTPSTPSLLPPFISPFKSLLNEEQARWWVGLENLQLEEEWERLRETRHFWMVHPWGQWGSLHLAKL